MTTRPNVFDEIDLTRARTEAEWLARLDEIGDELGVFEPLGTQHAAFFADGNDTLLVGFESVAQIRSTRADQRPLGQVIAQRHGWSSLSLLARAPRWYRDAEVLDFFDAQIDEGFFDSFARVLFYGEGMHGYAACAFSLAAPGATVLAIAPQATLDPDIAPWERRFRSARRFDFRSRFGYAPNMLEGARNVFVVFDPSHKTEAMHATLFRQPFVTVLRSPRLGRDTAAGLERIGVLDTLIETAARGRLTPARFFDMMRKRRQDPDYLKALVKRAANRGHQALTVIAARAAMAQGGAAPRKAPHRSDTAPAD
ncbi:MAG: phosphoadenosine phosphosulfate reductase [Rhodobacteraceae bacterium]|nr:MAG: phosphoadenosine phosphosulfate reductase [Paracoccaceae bacterium]